MTVGVSNITTSGKVVEQFWYLFFHKLNWSGCIYVYFGVTKTFIYILNVTLFLYITIIVRVSRKIYHHDFDIIQY